MNLGYPNEDIWVDPIILPVSTAGEGQNIAVGNLEFIKILQDVLPGVKSTVGLSNISERSPCSLKADPQPYLSRHAWEERTLLSHC